MVQRPEVFQRAREELDRVVKPGQLPDFDDQPSLPFITAIAKESLRWRNVAPMGKLLYAPRMQSLTFKTRCCPFPWSGRRIWRPSHSSKFHCDGQSMVGRTSTRWVVVLAYVSLGLCYTTKSFIQIHSPSNLSDLWMEMHTTTRRRIQSLHAGALADGKPDIL